MPMPQDGQLELLFVVDSRHHGKGKIQFSWNPNGSCVATTGSSRVVHIVDKLGQIIDQIVPPSPSTCTTLQWDSRGGLLAIVQAASSIIVLWHIESRSVRELDTGFKDLTFLQWSPSGKHFAVGTAKGVLLIYDKDTLTKKEVVSRHKKRIVCGAWSAQECVAFAAEDRQITICSCDGVTLGQVKVKTRPHSVSFGNQGSIVSVNLDGRTILLYNLAETDNALELAFQKRYGQISSFEWFGDGYIMAGFSTGFLVVISTHVEEIGREQFCAKLFDNELHCIAHSPEAHLVASCGDHRVVKVIDMHDWKETKAFMVDKDAECLDSCAWADSGKILSVSSRSGCLYTFLVRFGEKEKNCEAHSSALAFALRPISLPRFITYLVLLSVIFVAFSA